MNVDIRSLIALNVATSAFLCDRGLRERTLNDRFHTSCILYFPGEGVNHPYRNSRLANNKEVSPVWKNRQNLSIIIIAVVYFSIVLVVEL